MGRREDARKIIRYGFICLFIVVLAALFFSWRGGAQEKDKNWVAHDRAEPVLRVHILAHDDSPAEQKLKNRIRDELLVLTDHYRHIPSYDELIGTIEKELVPLENLLNDRLKEMDKDHDHRLKVDLREEYFPLRHYGEEIYPPGKYMALIISIGKGEGQNWWCLLYPPLCFPLAEVTDEVEREDQEDDEEAVTEAVAQKEDEDEVIDAPAGSRKRTDRHLPEVKKTRRWKFKIWEWIKNYIEKE